jgi:hypothetical protein
MEVTMHNRAALARSLERTATIAGRTCLIRFEHGHDGRRRGWINAAVTVGGVVIEAGGGWVDEAGNVTAYDRAENGDIEALAQALGLDPADEGVWETLLADLRRALPTTWS